MISCTYLMVVFVEMNYADLFPYSVRQHKLYEQSILIWEYSLAIK